MQDTKYWLDSTTIRGALVTVIPALVLIVKVFGVQIGSGEQQSLIDGVTAIVGLIGTIVAIIGRFRATKQLTT